MDDATFLRCRGYLDSLAEQISIVVPPKQGGYGSYTEPIPLERLPTVAALVREYVECEALLASVPRPSAEQPNSATGSDD